jgi:hypothetical protein
MKSRSNDSIVKAQQPSKSLITLNRRGHCTVLDCDCKRYSNKMVYILEQLNKDKQHHREPPISDFLGEFYSVHMFSLSFLSCIKQN